MESPVVSSLVNMQSRLEGGTLRPALTEAKPLLQEVQRQVGGGELSRLLASPHLRALMEAHDLVANRSFQSDLVSTPDLQPPPSPDMSDSDSVRLVGIRKGETEPLGITVRSEDGRLLIARILAGGIVDRQGLLHVGDTILEVNGHQVQSPEQLRQQLHAARSSVTFKILPSFQDHVPSSASFMKALFSYDPSQDSLVPCKEIGLSFTTGDILHILNQEDPNWWQARVVGSSGPAGLIPSQELEERRRAFVKPEFDLSTKTSMCGTKVTKKKRKTMYQTKSNSEFDKAELLLYEEVARMPPFRRKTLVLLGAQGVGRRTMKSRLIHSDPERFASPLPHTSRPMREGEEDGRQYHFVSREAMEADIAENQYLEWGEHGGWLYGTKLDSIRAILRTDKMCVLDCNPQSLKLLKTSEFLPYVVLISSPAIEQLRMLHQYRQNHSFATASFRSLTFDRAMGRHSSRRARTLESLATLCEEEDLRATVEESARLLRAYHKDLDLVLVNSDHDKTFHQLKESIDGLTSQEQWVPISWVY